MNSPEHLEKLNDVLNPPKNEILKKFIESINKRIDSTVNKVGGRAHRCDFSHDPRVQGIKTASENPNEWFKNFEHIKKTKIITQLHQIQDVAVSTPGQTINGHEITQEMIDKAKQAVEQMKNGKMPDLKEFKWTFKNGPKMSNPAAKNTIWKNIKVAFKPSNLHKAGKVGAKAGAISGGITSVVRNGWSVYKGRKSFERAGIDVGKDTISAGVSGYTASIAGYGTTVLIVACASNPAGWVILVSATTTSIIVGGVTYSLTSKGLNKTEEYIKSKM